MKNSNYSVSVLSATKLGDSQDCGTYPSLFLYRLDMAIQAERCVDASIIRIPSLSESQIIADSGMTRIKIRAIRFICLIRDSDGFRSLHNTERFADLLY